MKIATRISRGFGQWRARRRTEAELYGLTDWELRDLGISRHDIPEVARNASYGAYLPKCPESESVSLI